MDKGYKMLKKFHHSYPLTVAWRKKAHYKVIKKHLNSDEKILYVFAAQKTDNPFDFFSTSVLLLTNNRFLIGRKRLTFGYFYDSVTPDMLNDFNIRAGLLWGSLIIDTVKEVIVFKKIQKKALYELEDVVSKYMIDFNLKYPELSKRRAKKN